MAKLKLKLKGHETKVNHSATHCQVRETILFRHNFLYNSNSVVKKSGPKNAEFFIRN